MLRIAAGEDAAHQASLSFPLMPLAYRIGTEAGNHGLLPTLSNNSLWKICFRADYGVNRTYGAENENTHHPWRHRPKDSGEFQGGAWSFETGLAKTVSPETDE